MDKRTTPEGAQGPQGIHLNTDALREALDGLHKGLRAAAAALEADLKRTRELREVAALFGVYREYRVTTDPERAQELRAILKAALDGYDTALLADLVSFGRWLDGPVGAVWEARVD